MAKIMETTNYGLFNNHELNRLVAGKINKVLKSMERRGWLDPFPMHCEKANNGKLRIKGGHHRFAAAMQLGIPVKYVVSDDDMTLFEVENTTTPWTVRDYIVSKCNEGSRDCREVVVYSEQTGIPIGLALSMFFGDAAGSGNAARVMKRDKYRIKNRQHPHDVASVVWAMQSVGVKFACNRALVQAVSKVLLIPEVDIARMIKQIRNHREVIEKQPHLQGYIAMLEVLYNRARKGNRFPLAFRAAEVATQRCLPKK